MPIDCRFVSGRCHILAALCAFQGLLPTSTGIHLRGPYVKPKQLSVSSLLASLGLPEPRFIKDGVINRDAVFHGLASKSVLLLGSSLDRYAHEAFCEAGGAKVVGNQLQGQACTVAGLTVAMKVHPGSGEQPYWRYFPNSTKDVMFQTPKFTRRILNGSEPSIVVVDDSLWAISKWWMWENPYDVSKAEEPLRKTSDLHRPLTDPDTHINRWCEGELQELMGWVVETFPQSRVAFRTAPTVAGGFGFGAFYNGTQQGASEQVMHQMLECVKVNTKRGLLYGKYEVVPYHDLLDDLLEKQTELGLDPSALFMDFLHPARQVSMHYMNLVLEHLEMPP